VIVNKLTSYRCENIKFLFYLLKKIANFAIINIEHEIATNWFTISKFNISQKEPLKIEAFKLSEGKNI